MRSKKRKPDVLQRLQQYLNEVNKTFTIVQLCKSLRIGHGESEQERVLATLNSLVNEGKLVRTSDGKFKPRMRGTEIIGTVDMTSLGYAFIESEQSKVDIFVPQHALNHALHGDTVKVFVRQTSRRPEGDVVEIVKRARTTFPGVIKINKGGAVVSPDSRHANIDIAVPLADIGAAKNGQKVLVSIEDWPKTAKLPTGKVVDVLGNVGENNTEMHAILAEYGLPYKFDPAVERSANRVKDDIEAESHVRRDFRDVFTVTIDPQDAKDFDDALSLRKTDKGLYEVGVHIADVTHYIKPGTVIDKEAINRATSVYLVDRTVPMLPERLSNGLCSLRPHEQKLCFSAVFELDENAHVVSRWFGKTIICSDHRFNYEEVQEIIDRNEGLHSDAILTLHKLAQCLRNERFRHGSVGFERAEARFDIDKNGKPIGVYFREDTPSHQLVEEFMLLANRSVAELIGKPKNSTSKPKTFVYRVHENPNEDKLFSLQHVALQLGYAVNFGQAKRISTELNGLLEKVRGGKAQNLLETLALRCMAKARYTTKNVGHYGLAFDFYTHFTSPIRRYPDMMVHRLLDRYLHNGKSAIADEYEALCKHSSEMEELAASAERASIKYKMAEFMQDKIGNEYVGTISGVTERGIYVEIDENKIEGMVPLRSLKSEYFYFDEDNYRVVGRSTGRTYTLGDSVHIRVVRVDMDKKQLDYTLVEDFNKSLQPASAKEKKGNGSEKKSEQKAEKGKRKRKEI